MGWFRNMVDRIFPKIEDGQSTKSSIPAEKASLTANQSATTGQDKIQNGGLGASVPPMQQGQMPASPPPLPDSSHSPDAKRAVDKILNRKGPDRPLVYYFQQYILPAATFENDPTLLTELAGERASNSGHGKPPLSIFWLKTIRACGQAGMLDPSLLDDKAQLLALYLAIKISTYKKTGYTIYVVTMPSPIAQPEAYFVGIVHKDGEPRDFMNRPPSTRYFTLERHDDIFSYFTEQPSNGPSAVLCERKPDGRHINHGVGPSVEITLFVDAIMQVVSGER